MGGNRRGFPARAGLSGRGLAGIGGGLRELPAISGGMTAGWAVSRFDNGGTARGDAVAESGLWRPCLPRGEPGTSLGCDEEGSVPRGADLGRALGGAPLTDREGCATSRAVRGSVIESNPFEAGRATEGSVAARARCRLIRLYGGRVGWGEARMNGEVAVAASVSGDLDGRHVRAYDFLDELCWPDRVGRADCADLDEAARAAHATGHGVAPGPSRPTCRWAGPEACAALRSRGVG